jgi:hypothetical protein
VRDFHQITHQIFSIEDILQGNFEPSKADWGTCLAIDDFIGIAGAFSTGRGKMICLFDRDNIMNEERETIDKRLTELFDGIFPNQSAFER